MDQHVSISKFNLYTQGTPPQKVTVLTPRTGTVRNERAKRDKNTTFDKHKYNNGQILVRGDIGAPKSTTLSTAQVARPRSSFHVRWHGKRRSGAIKGARNERYKLRWSAQVDHARSGSAQKEAETRGRSTGLMLSRVWDQSRVRQEGRVARRAGGAGAVSRHRMGQAWPRRWYPC